MTWNNHSPLANPLNQHYDLLKGFFKKDSKAALPDSSMSYADFMEYLNSLHVPGAAISEDSILNTSSLDMRSYGLTWNDRDVNSFSQQDQMSLAEIERERYMLQLNAKLSAEMSPEQREMLNSLDNILGKSRLIEESRKTIN